MNVPQDIIRDLYEQVDSLADDHKWSHAWSHAREDSIRAHALDVIVEYCDDPYVVEVAKIALSTSRIDFPRYCA